jgi:hypothetical protein
VTAKPVTAYNHRMADIFGSETKQFRKLKVQSAPQTLGPAAIAVCWGGCWTGLDTIGPLRAWVALVGLKLLVSFPCVHPSPNVIEGHRASDQTSRNAKVLWSFVTNSLQTSLLSMLTQHSGKPRRTALALPQTISIQIGAKHFHSTYRSGKQLLARTIMATQFKHLFNSTCCVLQSASPAAIVVHNFSCTGHCETCPSGSECAGMQPYFHRVFSQ